MPIKSTLNIHNNVLEQIAHASDVLGRSQSEVIISLLMMVMQNDCNRTFSTGRLRYQERDDEDTWNTEHISYMEYEYEYFMDLKKILKMSLSHIVAFAVKKYLDDILNGKSSDNNQYENYIFAGELANGVICWKLFWGFPTEIEKFITIDT